MSNPRRKARWHARRRRAAEALKPILTAARWPRPGSPAYRPLADEWVPDVANAHLQDAARGLSSLCLPLHPPSPLPPCQNHSQAGRRRC